MVAMERGEVQASSTSWTAIKVGKKDWLRDKKIRIILQTAPERAHDLPDAPSLAELGTTPEDKQVFDLYASGSAIGRALMGPPEIPADRVKLLRDAFQATMKDPEFLAEAEKLQVDVEPLTRGSAGRAGAEDAGAAGCGAPARRSRLRARTVITNLCNATASPAILTPA